MANLVKKTGNQLDWSPFRSVRDFFGWDPFREMAPVTQELEAFYPNFEVTENKEAYSFKADLPGMKKEDIEITAMGNRIQISGKREAEKETKDDTVYTYERQYGSFVRAFTLPEGADLEHAKSDLADGVLTLVIPKIAEVAAKKIAIASGKKS